MSEIASSACYVAVANMSKGLKKRSSHHFECADIATDVVGNQNIERQFF